MKTKQYMRIEKLKKKYSETNIAKGERVSTATRKNINDKYYDNQQRRVVDGVLNNVRNKDTVKEEVHEIVKTVRLKDLCHNCEEELIISVIILYCFKSRNSQYRIERTRLWKEYNLNWRIYSLIISNLLKVTRENTDILVNKYVDENKILW